MVHWKVANVPEDMVPWGELIGGYGTFCDPRPLIDSAANGSGSWDDVFQELYHQGDVGTASYAAVPILARIAETAAVTHWIPFGLSAAIEDARLFRKSPDIPQWLCQDYAAAWDRLFEAARRCLADAEDPPLVQSLLAVLSFYKKQPLLGHLASDFTTDELGEMIARFELGED